MDGFSKLYSKNNIGLVPTYRCNASCEFCYAKDFQKKFPADMTWSVFKRVVNRFRNEGKDEVSFFGGEPTIWKYINEAVLYLKRLNFQVNFFTNGLTHPDISPDCVIINVYNIFDKKKKKLIEKAVDFYRAKEAEIGLRYNIDYRSPNEKDSRFLKLIELWSDKIDYLSISPAVPYPFSRNLGNRIYNLAHKIHIRRWRIRVSRALPICLFDANQLKFLREKCFLHKKCFSVKNIIVNPDGETVYPCVNVFKEKNWKKENLERITDFYRQYFFDLGHVYFGRCGACKYAKNYKCQAGCLGGKESLLKNCCY